MKITFSKFLDIINEKSEDSKVLDLIRFGNGLRKNECGNFWNDFISICAKSDALSDLLGVQKEKITGWAEKINKLRAESGQKDSSSKNKIIGDKI
jgi:hypothetical protein